jgi:hypothetical protein
MSQKSISPLRRRMIDDMTVRKFAEKTRNDYIRHVKTFVAFLGRSPDTATPEDLRLFQLHQSVGGGARDASRVYWTRHPRRRSWHICRCSGHPSRLYCVDREGCNGRDQD